MTSEDYLNDVYNRAVVTSQILTTNETQKKDLFEEIKDKSVIYNQIVDDFVKAYHSLLNDAVIKSTSKIKELFSKEESKVLEHCSQLSQSDNAIIDFVKTKNPEMTIQVDGMMEKMNTILDMMAASNTQFKESLASNNVCQFDQPTRLHFDLDARTFKVQKSEVLEDKESGVTIYIDSIHSDVYAVSVAFCARDDEEGENEAEDTERENEEDEEEIELKIDIERRQRRVETEREEDMGNEIEDDNENDIENDTENGTEDDEDKEDNYNGDKEKENDDTEDDTEINTVDYSESNKENDKISQQ